MRSFRSSRFARAATPASMLAAGLLLVLPLAARAQSIQQNLWVTDYDVDAMVVVNNILYLGGGFTRVGPPVAGTAALDVSTGAPQSTYLSVGRSDVFDARPIVLAVAPDGAGGWFIGGYFTEVNGQPRSNLAWLDAAGHVLPWNPDPNAAVHALTFTNGRLYVGGDFTSLGGLPRSGLALFEGASSIPSSWNPGPNGSIACMVESGGTVYVGGQFTIIGGQFRNSLAAIDANGVATAWNPNPNGPTDALAVGGGLVYAGGQFNMIGGAARSDLAALDASGAANAWNPGPDGIVRALALSGSTLYVGGGFSTISGASRNGLAAVNAVTGAPTSWDPHPDNVSGIDALLIHGGLVYAAGGFGNIGGQARSYVAALDPATGLATAWNPSPERFVNALAASGNVVYVGGQFLSIGMQPRRRLAAIDLSTGQPTTWNPDVNGPGVHALLFDGTNFYVGGFFDAVGGQARSYLAQVDLNGNVTSWNPGANDEVNALAAYNGVLYVGGYFTAMAGFVRSNLAAFDLATGFLTTWNPNVSGIAPTVVNAIAVRPSPNGLVPGALIVGGGFLTIGGQPRVDLGAVDEGGGVLSWNPNPNGGVAALSVINLPRLDFRVYVGGNFTSIGGQSRRGLAAIDGGGIATAWNPNPLDLCETCTDNTPAIFTITASGGIVYVGGRFTNIGGVDRSLFAGLDPNSGIPTAWDAGFASDLGNYDVMASAFAGGNIYLGGFFEKMRGAPRSHLVGLSPTSVSVAGERVSPMAGTLLAQPNPSRGVVTLRFAAPEGEEADVAIYDLAGRRVRSLSTGALRAGEQKLTWDGRNDRGADVPSGLYFGVVRGPSVNLRAKILRLE